MGGFWGGDKFFIGGGQGVVGLQSADWLRHVSER